ncbi:MAG: FixH family protein [Chloroflexia bacterium]
MARASLGDRTLHAAVLILGSLGWLFVVRPPRTRAWAWFPLGLVPPGVLVATSLPVALDWLHLLAMSLWVGGLVALVAVVPCLFGAGAADREAMFGVLVPRFTRLALPCVLVLTATGIYAAVIHLGRLSALTGSSYGLSLTRRRSSSRLSLRSARRTYCSAAPAFACAYEGLRTPASRGVARFGRTVRLEVVLVALVLLATGFLTSLAPPDEAQSAEPEAAYAQTLETPEGEVALALDPAIAGVNVIEVRLTEGGEPIADASKVAVRYSMEGAGVAESEAVARHTGDGRYVVTGPQLASAGEWRIEIIARRPGLNDLRATFEAPVAAPITATGDGLRAELRAAPREPTAGEGAQLELTVREENGEPVAGASVKLTLLMPQHAHYEDVVLRDLGDGRYQTEAELAIWGEWIAQVEVRRPGGRTTRLNPRFPVAEPAR